MQTVSAIEQSLVHKSSRKIFIRLWLARFTMAMIEITGLEKLCVEQNNKKGVIE